MTVRRITAWECEQAGMPGCVTLAELIAATVYARRRGDTQRAELYAGVAVRDLLRAQEDARRERQGARA